MARLITLTKMEDGSVVLAIPGERAIPLSPEEFAALQRLIAPLPAIPLHALVEMTPFPTIEGLVV